MSAVLKDERVEPPPEKRKYTAQLQSLERSYEELLGAHRDALDRIELMEMHAMRILEISAAMKQRTL